MYEAFYGLKQKPFELNPDPAFHYMSSGHEEAYLHLKYAILENKGFVVITGEIGCGKTTLVNVLLGEVRPRLKVGLINHTIVAPAEFLAMACREFKLQVNGGGKVRCLELIENFLLKQRSSGKRVTLIIDEAQNLSMETLEEIRMLSNLETEKHSLIQIILVGQPELKRKLQHKTLMQLTQRVTVSYHLGALAPDEVSTYIHRRLQASGRKGTSLFHPEAMETIGRYSEGVPRIINIVCDSALMLGFSDRAHVINKRIIEDVIKVRESGSIFGGSAVSTPIQGSPQSEPSSLAKGASPLDNQVQLMVNELSSIKAALERIESHLRRIVEPRSSRS